jgi:4-diphosphocytidyl-2-C-methyl-D-erythritol kinase
MKPAPRRRRVRVEARAKLNLGLAVGPRRDDGFHDLATVFQSVSLADTLEVRPRRAGFTLRLHVEDAALRRGPRARVREDVPAGDDNLVLRAARLLATHDPRIGGAAFTLTKRIPAQSGMGGGSADAAATLVALDTLHGIRRPRAERMALAARLGSDVPFAVFGGTALGLGRGDVLSRMRLDRPFRAVVAVPAWRIPTGPAFAALDRRKSGLTLWSRKLSIANRLSRVAVTPQDAVTLGNAFEDVLGERRAGFDSLRARLRAAGADPVRMTGSGSAVFGVLPPGITFRRFLGRFTGDEILFGVHSRGAGMRLETLP